MNGLLRRLAGRGLASLTVLCLWAAAPVHAEDMPVFQMEMKDGKITPTRLEVPANTRFKIELHNTGTSPAEFESTELRKEKVLAAQSSSFLVFHKLEAGEYKFFDDFHPNAASIVLVAK